MKKLNKVILIPARSGSKRLKDKNIRLLNGKPLIAHSIILAKKVKDIDHVIVSTDSRKYAKIAESYGAKCFYLRPKKFSNDTSTDLEVFKYNEYWLNKYLNYKTDLYIHLRPTFPNRKVKDINQMLEIFIKHYKYMHSLRSVKKVEEKLEKFYRINKKGYLTNVLSFKKFKIKNNYDYLCNQADQLLPQYYAHDGAVDIFKSNLLKKNTISGNKILAYVTNYKHIDINTLEDFKKNI